MGSFLSLTDLVHQSSPGQFRCWGHREVSDWVPSQGGHSLVRETHTHSSTMSTQYCGSRERPALRWPMGVVREDFLVGVSLEDPGPHTLQ